MNYSEILMEGSGKGILFLACHFSCITEMPQRSHDINIQLIENLHLR